MESIKKITKQYLSRGLWISGPQFLSVAVQLVTLPIVLRAIPADMYGGFQFAFAVFVWITLFSVNHITLGASRGVAMDKLGTFLYAFFYRLRIVVPLGLVTVLVAYFYDPSRGAFQQLLMIVGAYIALGYLPQMSFVQFFVARQQFKNYFTWQAILLVLAPICATIAAVVSGDVRIYALAQFGTVTVVSIVGMAWILMRNKVVQSYLKGEIDRSVVRYGFSLVPAGIIQGTSNQLVSFVIGPFLGFVNLAIYSVASRVEAAVRNFFSSVYQMTYADFARKDLNELKFFLRERQARLFGGAVLVSVLVAIPGFLYIQYVMPELYGSAAKLYLILVVGFPAVLWQMILNTVLASHLRHRALLFSGIFPSIIKIALVVALGFSFGIMGVAVAVALSAWISCGFYQIAVFYNDFFRSLKKSPENK